ncbi:MAG TPA: S49 family peptidase, partial [Opitutales bacterium]|nr:S49 family peptidase [Opitutales bacterium]
KYGVGIQVVRVGKYKSAIEPLTLSAMSPENKEETSFYLDQTWQYVLQQVGASRKLTLDNLLNTTDQHLIIPAHEALGLGLVDTIKNFDEVLDTLGAVATEDKELGSFRQIEMVDYIASLPEPKKHKARIAVIYAEGEIVDGEGAYDQVGGDSLARELRALRKDEDVKAVVLRINSPGGDSFASEVIGREVA